MKQLWAMYFATVASIRLHPRQVPDLADGKSCAKEIQYAAMIAEQMLRITEERWQCQSDTGH